MRFAVISRRHLIEAGAVSIGALGMHARLYHGLIRTAFGLRFEDDAELAHGLAYWASYAESLAPSAEPSDKERDVAALFAGEAFTSDAYLRNTRLLCG